MRLALDGAFETAAPPVAAPAAAPPRPLWRRAIPVAVAAILAGALTFAAAWSLRPSPPPLAVTRSVFPLPEGQSFTNPGRNTVAISPDGARMVYVANSRLYLRSLSEVDARPITGTERFQNVINPVFSPDGQSVAFFTAGDNTIKRIAVTGGAAVTIAPATNPFGMSWGPDGIVFGQAGAGILRVSAAGGTPQVLVKVNEDETADSPQVLPDGEHVLFTLATGTAVRSMGAGKNRRAVTRVRRATRHRRGRERRPLSSDGACRVRAGRNALRRRVRCPAAGSDGAEGPHRSSRASGERPLEGP